MNEMPHGALRISAPLVWGWMLLFQLVELGESGRPPQLRPEAQILLLCWRLEVMAPEWNHEGHQVALSPRAGQLQATSSSRAPGAPSKRPKIIEDCILQGASMSSL